MPGLGHDACVVRDARVRRGAWCDVWVCGDAYAAKRVARRMRRGGGKTMAAYAAYDRVYEAAAIWRWRSCEHRWRRRMRVLIPRRQIGGGQEPALPRPRRCDPRYCTRLSRRPGPFSTARRHHGPSWLIAGKSARGGMARRKIARSAYDRARGNCNRRQQSNQAYA
jgi:hypothetical protein